jgi:hypothetical protein
MAANNCTTTAARQGFVVITASSDLPLLSRSSSLLIHSENRAKTEGIFNHVTTTKHG